jgi:phospholipid/cholesterol/gamma-HCH transport system substrate-binding protein
MNVRGVRNIPCETKPDKRSPTVELCESDEQYIPLNDGLNWKGDPNAKLSGQGVPQYAPGLDPRVPPPQAPVQRSHPATADDIRPDGERYTQADLAHPQNKTWQSMLVPPTP